MKPSLSRRPELSRGERVLPLQRTVFNRQSAKATSNSGGNTEIFRPERNSVRDFYFRT